MDTSTINSGRVTARALAAVLHAMKQVAACTDGNEQPQSLRFLPTM